ncbi:uncharacterized protein IWZ02DRAFT_293845 [Phyllosticta citriasiana]|uniref:uncharacterized protein n=1 Tax=Phyllosticta citriasiana TaxID=595635 RepID=UPI0030FDE39D
MEQNMQTMKNRKNKKGMDIRELADGWRQGGKEKWTRMAENSTHHPPPLFFYSTKHPHRHRHRHSFEAASPATNSRSRQEREMRDRVAHLLAPCLSYHHLFYLVTYFHLSTTTTAATRVGRCTVDSIPPPHKNQINQSNPTTLHLPLPIYLSIYLTCNKP